MADPKKNPLIGAFRAPVPGAPPDIPAPPEAGKTPAAGAGQGGNPPGRWSRQAYRREERTGGPQDPCGHYSQAH